MQNKDIYNSIPEELISVKYDVGNCKGVDKMDINCVTHFDKYYRSRKELVEILSAQFQKFDDFEIEELVASLSDTDLKEICEFSLPKAKCVNYYIIATLYAINQKNYDLAAKYCQYAVNVGYKIGYLLYLYILCLKGTNINYIGANSRAPRYAGVKNSFIEAAKFAWNAGFVHSGIVVESLFIPIYHPLRIYRFLAAKKYVPALHASYDNNVDEKYLPDIRDRIISLLADVILEKGAPIFENSFGHFSIEIDLVVNENLHFCKRNTIFKLLKCTSFLSTLPSSFLSLTTLYKKRINELHNMYKYMPEAPGYRESEKSFEDHKNVLQNS